MTLAHALTITIPKLKDAFSSMPTEELKALYEEANDPKNWRDGDDFQSVLVVITQAYKKRTC